MDNTTDHWKRTRALFRKALEQPAARQVKFIRTADEEEGVRQEALALLQAAERTGQPLESIVARAAAGMDAAPELDTVIGSYRLNRLLGEGGMGTVYLAERADERFEQQVALKLLSAQRPATELVARFIAERQMLAKLEHPNIARLLDGGETDTGVPYLVMEYVDGQAIDGWCDTRQLETRARIELFLDVCAAVDHAHRNLIIHRDVKPSNIAVTDGGQVKLLDFGIAKLLEADADLRLTRPSARVMSPLNASPEQVRGEPVTVATDIYALGVLLYELLSGVHPYAEHVTSPQDIERAICDTDPARPSARLTGSSDSARYRETHQASPESLARALGGDLDNIVMKALEKTPERRYASVLEFADDLRRYLDGRPVLARPATLVYRAQKFVGRNRAATAVAAAAATALLVGGAVSVNRVTAERDAAVVAQRNAEAVSRFLQNIFRQAEPNTARGEPMTVIDLLDLGRQQVSEDLDGQLETQLRMRRILGETYYDIGARFEANEQMDLALAVADQLAQPNLAEVGSAKLILAFIAQDTSDFDRAETLFQESRVLREQHHGGPHLDVAEVISAQAYLLENLGERDKAIALYREAHDMMSGLHPDGHGVIGEILTKWAGVLRDEDDNEGAERMLRDALDIMIPFYGEPNLNIAKAKRHLASIYRDTRQYEASEALYVEVIDAQKKLLGETAIELGNTYNEYSQMLDDKGDLPEAVRMAEAFMRILDANHTGPNASYGAAYNNYAYLQHDAGDYDAAIASFERSMAEQDAIGLAPDHFHRSYPIYGMAHTYMAKGDVDTAITLYRQALPMRQQHFDASHLNVTQVQLSLAEALFTNGELDEAEVLVRDAIGHLRTEQGDDHPRTKAAEALIADIEAQRDATG